MAWRLGVATGIKELLPSVLENMTKMTDAERAVFALLDANGRVHDAVTHNLDWRSSEPLPISHSFLHDVLSSSDVRWVPNVAEDDTFSVRDSVRSNHICFMAGAPVILNGRTLGVLYIDSQAHTVPEAQKQVQSLRSLAEHVAMAVHNALLYEEQRFRTRLSAWLIHNLKSPLASIIANGNELRRGLASSEGVQDGLRMAEDIVSCAERIDQMTRRTRALVDIDEGHQEAPQSVDLVRLLERYAQSMQVLLSGKEQTLGVLDVETPRYLRTVKDWLLVVLDNLVFNSYKYGPEKCEINIGLQSREDAGPEEARHRPESVVGLLFRKVRPLYPDPKAGFTEICVENPGVPIPASVQSSMFIERVHDESKAREDSSGLGLSIVDQVVRYLGGLVWYDGSDPEKVVFRFTLPNRLVSNYRDSLPGAPSPDPQAWIH